MSHTYKPGFVDDTQVREELAQLQRALNDAQPEFTFAVRHAEPARKFAGMVVNADGADWNPGSGEGLYRRDKANAAWVFIG